MALDKWGVVALALGVCVSLAGTTRARASQTSVTCQSSSGGTTLTPSRAPAVAPLFGAGPVLRLRVLLRIAIPLSLGCVLVCAWRRRDLAIHVIPLVALLWLLAGCAYFLRRNAIDVSSARGRGIYGALALSLLVLFGAYSWWSLATARRPLSVARWGPLVGVFGRTGQVLLGVVLLLFAAEAWARTFPVFDSQCVNPGTRFFWPDFFDARNSLGYNDREPTRKRGPRVLVTGDSYTEGAGVAKSMRFSCRLEKLLRETDPSVEVFNAGACGTHVEEQAACVEKTGDQVEPDAVVIALTYFDLAGLERKEAAKAPAASPSPQAGGKMQLVFDRLFMHTLGSYAYYRLQVFTRDAFTLSLLPPAVQVAKPTTVNTRAEKRILEGVGRLGRWCDQRGIRLYVVLIPWFSDTPDFCALCKGHWEVLARDLERLGYPCWNTFDDFAGHLGQFGLSKYDRHPGPQAHAILAQRLRVMLGHPSQKYHRPQR